MHKAPLILGIDYERAQKPEVFFASKLDSLGKNTGNILFSESLYRLLFGARRSTIGFHPSELEDRDCIVIAAANWLQPSANFDDLVNRLQNVKLPIYIVGIGAQSPNDTIPRLSEGTLRLMRLVADRSCAISTRGDFTSEVLSHYGIKNTVATGCPSLLLSGPQGPQVRGVHEIDVANVCFHGTRHQFNSPDDFQAAFYREAFRNRCDILLQSELADMYYALSVKMPDHCASNADNMLVAAYGAANIGDVAEYLVQHGKVWFSLDKWLSYIKTKSFFIGSRIHCTIASLIGGTPAVLISHDSRTRELATKMNIPFVDGLSMRAEFKINIQDIIHMCDTGPLHTNYANYYNMFMSFFAKNDLQVETV